METDTKKTISAFKFISGENYLVCRFCLSPTENNEVELNKLIEHDLEYCTDSVNFYDMLGELGIENDDLPQDLCIACAQSVITSYLLQKKIEYSIKMWKKYVERFEDSISRTDVLHLQTQTLFIVLNNDSSILYTSKKQKATWTKVDVLKKVQHMAKGKEQNEKIKSAEVVHVCHVCGDHFLSELKLTKHMKMHQNIKYPCNVCGRKFSSRAGVSSHIERIHYEKTLKCSMCNNMYSTQSSLKQHKKNQHEAVKCKICSEECPSRVALRAHLDKHERLQCSRCNKNYINKVTYKFHLTICGKKKPDPSFFCDMCGKGYIRKNGLRTHLKIDHGFGKVLSCNWCGKKYDAMSKLKHHIVKHTREKNFHCEICGGRYVTLAALIYHTRLHTGEKPYPCDECGESFLSTSRRNEHKLRRHLGPKHECHVCHRKFVTRSQLRIHVERHYNPQSKLFVTCEKL